MKLLEIEERFRPEVLITVSYAEKVEPSYRAVDEIIEKLSHSANEDGNAWQQLTLKQK